MRNDHAVTASHVPLAAVVGVTGIAAAFSALVRLMVLEKGDDRPGIWNIFAVGPDLIVGAVVAVPSLLAGKNIGQPKSDWNPNGLLVLTILFLFGACVAFERLWCKKARERHGWKEPVLKGIIPPALCGFLALGVALALGAAP